MIVLIRLLKTQMVAVLALMHLFVVTAFVKTAKLLVMQDVMQTVVV